VCDDARAVARLRGEKLDQNCPSFFPASRRAARDAKSRAPDARAPDAGFICAIKSDEHKFRRVNDLLEMRNHLREVRKIDHAPAGD